MKLRRYWPLYVLLISITVLGGRLAWIVSASPLGWRPHLDQWANVATDLTGIEQTPLSDQEPAQQAEFWLSEVERVTSATTDPQVAMGAAWMLDTPQYGFIKHQVRTRDEMSFPGVPARRELDDEAISKLADEFEVRCREKCQVQIETAVRLAPSQAELRRARALLLFNTPLFGSDFHPRQEDWFVTLNECAQIDLDNALYDYLAALQFWTASASFEWTTNGYIRTVNDADMFERGNVAFAKGLIKHRLSFGTEVYSSTFAFLEHSTVSQADVVTLAGSRHRIWEVLRQIREWREVQLDADKSAGRFSAAVATLKDILRISDQITADGNTLDLYTLDNRLRIWGIANLQGIVEEHPNLMTADEAARVETDLAKLRLERRVEGEVSKWMSAKAGEWLPREPIAANAVKQVATQVLAVFLMMTAQILVVVTATLAMISLLAARFLGTTGDVEPVPIGWLRNLVAWCVAFGLSIALLGMFPFERVASTVQEWFGFGLMVTLFFVVVLSSLFFFQRQFRLPRSQFAALVITACTPIAVVLCWRAMIELAIDSLASLPPLITILGTFAFAALGWLLIQLCLTFARSPTRSRKSKFVAVSILALIAFLAVPAALALEENLTQRLEMQRWDASPVWSNAKNSQSTWEKSQNSTQLVQFRGLLVFIQWLRYHGPIAPPVMAAVILLIWGLFRTSRRRNGGVRKIFRSEKRIQIRLGCYTVAKSCAVASLVFLAIYLATVPVTVHMADQYHRVWYERMMNPSIAWEELAEGIAKVRADENTMQRLQRDIDEHVRRLAEQKADSTEE